MAPHYYDDDSERAHTYDRQQTTTIPTEHDRLLGDQGHDSLYRTLSRRSEADFLPQDDSDAKISRRESVSGRKRSPWATLSVLLLGCFIANADSSLVLATYGRVASEFHDLDSGSWLLSSYILAMSAVQPLYGKLSDIYGRKPVLLVAYAMFAIGNLGAGLGRSLGEVIAWRAVQGIGGAGMGSLVAIIIVDIVPMHDVASTRSYVNIMQTSGRTCGGVIGGWLTQTLGWRWAFLVQVPPTLAALTMVAIALKLPAGKASGDKTQSNWDRVKRIDFTGALFLGATILSLCLILDLGGTRIPWNSSWMFVLIGSTVACGIIFIISAKYAAEPIFPLELATHYVVVTNYLVILLQTTAQSALMISVPIYFQVTAAATTSEAGAHLIPAFAGNTLGGLVAGYWIKRTGFYKPLTVLSPIMGVICTLNLLLLWDGHTSPWLSLLIFPGGLAMGFLSSSAFVGLAAGVEEEGIAVTTSGMFLAFNIGGIAGVSGGSAVLQNVLRSSLGSALDGVDGGEEIMRKALADIGYVQTASKAIKDLLIPAYVTSFHSVNIFSIACSVLAVCAAVITKGGRIERTKH